MAKLTKKQVIEAIENSGGVIKVIARKCGVSRKAIYDFIEKYPDVKEAFQDEKEGMIDLAEGKLFGAVKKGEAWAIKTVLQTIGKDRGYTEKQEHDHKHSGEVGFKFNYIAPKTEDAGN